MDRRDFIKSGLLAVAVGAVSGPKVIAQEAERQVAREQLSKKILNYNPQMQYRPMGRTGVNVSALGFGMLRLPMRNGHVDFDQTTPMVRRAIEGGVNYIDTGRVYLGGESEQAVGKALAGDWRDRVYVTSKMPWWEMRSADDFEKFFDQSRRTIGTDVSNCSSAWWNIPLHGTSASSSTTTWTTNTRRVCSVRNTPPPTAWDWQ